MNNLLEIHDLSKTYYTLKNETKVLNNINLNVANGEFISVVGASGCGKSTLLNIIAGLDNEYDGIIKKQGNINIGYMLQIDALLPWLTIKENCSLGLFLNNKKDDDKVNYYLNKYGLNDFANSYPNELSGGMKQRCALIRTLVLDPDILLLDEPFSALDYQTRIKVEEDILSIIKNEHKTAILVTHDLEEAISMSTKVIVLSKRPAKIKKIYDINLISNNILGKRNEELFKDYFKKIWNDLDEV